MPVRVPIVRVGLEAIYVRGDALMTRIAPSGGTDRLGGDPHAMRRAAHEFDEQAERIRSYGEAMSAEVHQMWWKGPDADRFRSDWEQVHLRASQKISGELRQLAACLRQEAAKQAGASRA